MPDWVTQLITALVSGGGVGAVAVAYVRVVTARHKNQREVRADEIDVLHQDMEAIRNERDDYRRELLARIQKSDSHKLALQREFMALKDEHTICLAEQARMQERMSHLEDKIDELKKLVVSLQTTIARYEGHDYGAGPAG